MKSDLMYLVYDLETTGLNSEKHAIIEIAITVMDNSLNNIAEYSSGIMCLYDNREITPKALECNGISRKQIEEGRDPKEVLMEVMTFIKSLKKPKTKLILCGQNIIEFDNKHIKDFFKVFKKDLDLLVHNSYYIDTLLWGRIKHEESPNYKLGTLCDNVGIEHVNAHRALDDAKHNMELLKTYIRLLRGVNSSTQEAQKEVRFREQFQF